MKHLTDLGAKMIKGEEVADYVIGLGEDSDSPIIDQIKKESFILKTLNIQDILDNDPHVAKVVKTELSEPFSYKNIGSPIVINSKGEVLDGEHRLQAKIKQGDATINAYVGQSLLSTQAGIPKELEPLAQEARKYKSVEEFINNASKILKEITTNEIRSLTPSIGKDRAGRVMIIRYHGTDIVLGVMVPWEKTTTIKYLAHGKREILKYLTDFYNQVTKERHLTKEYRTALSAKYAQEAEEEEFRKEHLK